VIDEDLVEEARAHLREREPSLPPSSSFASEASARATRCAYALSG